MAIESDILQLIVGNGVGVAFGYLMYQMANTSIKENTKITSDLRDAIILLTEKLNNGKQAN